LRGTPSNKEFHAGNSETCPQQRYRVRAFQPFKERMTSFLRNQALANGDSAGTSSTKTPVTPGRLNVDISPSRECSTLVRQTHFRAQGRGAEEGKTAWVMEKVFIMISAISSMATRDKLNRKIPNDSPWPYRVFPARNSVVNFHDWLAG
jgi:hypothetical protein